MGKVIVYCLDEKYIKYTAISINSVRKFNPDAKIVVVSEFNQIPFAQTDRSGKSFINGRRSKK